MEHCEAAGWAFTAFVVVTRGAGAGMTQSHLKNKFLRYT